MASNFFVYDHRMNPLVQIDTTTRPRTWQLNVVGPCQFSIGLTDEKCTEMNLQYNNLVRVEHVQADATKGKLPDWVGVILPRRQWNKGVLNASAFSAEAILTLRPMPWTKIEGTPRMMFLKILEYATQAASDIVIQPGVVDDMDLILSDDLRGNAYDHIISLIKKCGMSWGVTGQVAQNGQLQLFANLRVRTGVNTGVQLNNVNSELHSPIMVEDGIPHNVVNGYSFASTARGRYRQTGINADALADYGYMGINKTFIGLHDASSTFFAAQTEANTYGRPLKLMGRTALNIDKLFDALRLGNVLPLDEKEAGFLPGGGIGVKAGLRILKMAFDDLDDRVVMMTEVLNGSNY